MPYINLPPVVSEMFWDLDRRIRSLETAYRFNAPNYDITNDAPANVRSGDIYYDTDSEHLVYWDGSQWKKLNQSNL
jgi:hypothetical protein